MEDSKLLELRNKIDAIDDQLLKLLAQRSEYVLEVGKLKAESGCNNNFIRSGREAKMLRDLTAKGAGNFPTAAIKSIWRSIISASLSLESGLKIAIPANSGFEFHRLAVDYFGGFTKFVEYQTDEEILEAIDKQTIGLFTLDSGWWLNLAEDRHKNLKIFAKLANDIYCVARLDTQESGLDKTIAITQTETHKGHQLATHGKVKLVEVENYYRTLDNSVVIGHYGV